MTNNKLIPVSVLISTYRGVKSEWLERCLNSLFAQTKIPSEIILVVDGPIPESQKKIIQLIDEKNIYGVRFIVLYLEVQSGLACAMNIALKNCTHDIVARMDSDDICHEERFEIQYNFLKNNEIIDIVCSWHAEFSMEDIILRIKKTPELGERILSQLEYRNVISHPTIMGYKKIFERIGGYSEDVGFLEDYDLYLKMRSLGAKFHCVQKELVNVRTSNEQFARRGGWNYVRNEVKFRIRMYVNDMIGLRGLLVGVTLYPLFRMMPLGLKKFLYRAVRDDV